MSSADKLAQAKELLEQVLAAEDCPWCRSHVELLRDAVGDVEQLSRFGASLTPERLKALRQLGSMADELHLLAFLSRIAAVVSKVQ